MPPWPTSKEEIHLPDAIHALVTRGEQQLLATSDSPKLDAELLLARAIGKSRTYLFTWPDRSVSAAEQEQFSQLIQARATGRPVAQLLGEKEFWSMLFEVNEQVLTPRPETELLVERALMQIPLEGSQQILDLGTGSGCIAAAIGMERPDCNILAVDVSQDALALAAKNVQRHTIRNIELRPSNWFAAIAPTKQFHLILSNPPYIAADDAHLQTPELTWEPRQALESGDDGLDDIRKIIQAAAPFLAPKGILLFEHGYNQAKAVQQLLEAAGFCEVQSFADLSGHLRVTSGRLG